jgi:hypothetical protein
MWIDIKHPFIRGYWWVLVYVSVVLSVVNLFLAFAWQSPSLGGLLRDAAGYVYLDLEYNAATWFSSILLATCSLSAFLVYSSLPSRRSLIAAGWLVAGFVFLFLSVDETAGFHERLGFTMGEPHKLSLGPFTWLSTSRWVLIYAVPILIFVVFLVLWIRKALAGEAKSRLAVLAGLACWIGVILLESLLFTIPEGLRPVEIWLEESLEMAGALLFIYAFARFQFSTGSS